MSITAASLTNEEYETRKKFLEELKGLVKEEQEHIFRIIKYHNIEFSENNNGVFFDVCTLSNSVFNKISEYMMLCRQNRDNFAEREQEKERLLKLLEESDEYTQ
jgi:hypothetical protein